LLLNQAYDKIKSVYYIYQMRGAMI